MTDREKLRALLTEFGVGYEDDGYIVCCREGMPKVEGYVGFYASFRFDAAGKFVGMGVYE